jgi:hypothetical protein
VSTLVPGRSAEAQELFCDLTRRPAWVDGFGHVVRADDGWPASGELQWQSRPGGRGRVREIVRDFAPAMRQVVAVEDETLHGVQEATFTDEGEDTRVTLSLEFELKRSVLGPLGGFFVRRSLTDSLRRTLGRFAAEREGDLHL